MNRALQMVSASTGGSEKSVKSQSLVVLALRRSSGAPGEPHGTVLTQILLNLTGDTSPLKRDLK